MPLRLIWSIAGLTVVGVVARPLRWPEAIWAICGAALLLALGLIGAQDAWTGRDQGSRRLSVPDRHDAAVRNWPASEGSIRMGLPAVAVSRGQGDRRSGCSP